MKLTMTNVYKRRPRINFNKIKNQIKKHCKLVFDDFIEKLR